MPHGNKLSWKSNREHLRRLPVDEWQDVSLYRFIKGGAH